MATMMDASTKKSLQVLLVEDDPSYALVIQKILARAKGDALPVERVDRLSRAKTLLADRRFDVVLLDLNLPDSSGLETVSRMRDICPSMPIVVLTGVDDREVALKAIRAGAQDYLTKEQIDGNFLIRAMRYAMARKREELRLQQAEAAAVAASQAKGAFIADLSERLRRPMCTIWGTANELGRELADNPELKAHVEAIQKDSAGIMDIVDEMMQQSTAGQGLAEPQFTQCDPYLLVNEVASMLQPRAAAKQLGLDMEYGRAILRYVRTNPRQFQHALFKLVGNAIKYTAQGRVVVRISLEWSETNPRLCVEVHDTGPGIPAATMAAVFQPDGSRLELSPQGGGGFGLTQVRRIAEELGGALTATSRDGGGSIASLWLATGPLDGIELIEHSAHGAYSPARPTARRREGDTQAMQASSAGEAPQPKPSELLAHDNDAHGAADGTAAAGAVASASA